MTHRPESVQCDHPGCGQIEPVDRWRELYAEGWRGYWTSPPDEPDARLEHHCGEHPVAVNDGEPLDLDHAYPGGQDVRPDEPSCRVCGCTTDLTLCDPPCSWIEDPAGLGYLCSSEHCVETAQREAITAAATMKPVEVRDA